MVSFGAVPWRDYQAELYYYILLHYRWRGDIVNSDGIERHAHYAHRRH